MDFSIYEESRSNSEVDHDQSFVLSKAFVTKEATKKITIKVSKLPFVLSKALVAKKETN